MIDAQIYVLDSPRQHVKDFFVSSQNFSGEDIEIVHETQSKNPRPDSQSIFCSSHFDGKISPSSDDSKWKRSSQRSKITPLALKRKMALANLVSSRTGKDFSDFRVKNTKKCQSGSADEIDSDENNPFVEFSSHKFPSGTPKKKTKIDLQDATKMDAVSRPNLHPNPNRPANPMHRPRQKQKVAVCSKEREKSGVESFSALIKHSPAPKSIPPRVDLNARKMPPWERKNAVLSDVNRFSDADLNTKKYCPDEYASDSDCASQTHESAPRGKEEEDGLISHLIQDYYFDAHRNEAPFPPAGIFCAVVSSDEPRKCFLARVLKPRQMVVYSCVKNHPNIFLSTESIFSPQLLLHQLFFPIIATHFPPKQSRDCVFVPQGLLSQMLLIHQSRTIGGGERGLKGCEEAYHDCEMHLTPQDCLLLGVSDDLLVMPAQSVDAEKEPFCGAEAGVGGIKAEEAVEEGVFQIYLHYMVSCVLDGDFSQIILEQKDEYFLDAVKLVDETLSGKQSILVENLSWQSDFLADLSAFSSIHHEKITSRLTCMACCRANRHAEFVIHLSGPFYNVCNFRKNPATLTENRTYYVGKECISAASKYHKLRHFPFECFQQCSAQVAKVEANCHLLTAEEVLGRVLNDCCFVKKLYRNFLSAVETLGTKMSFAKEEQKSKKNA